MATSQKESNVELNNSTFSNKQRLLNSGPTSQKDSNFGYRGSDDSSNAINSNDGNRNSNLVDKIFLDKLYQIPDDKINRIEEGEKHNQHKQHKYLLDSWETYFSELIRIEGSVLIDNCILDHYHDFATFMTDRRVILVWLALVVYYTVGFLAIMLYANDWKTQLAYYLTNLLLFKVAYECIITVKPFLFGKLTDDFEDIHNIGGYELLDAIHRYLEGEKDFEKDAPSQETLTAGSTRKTDSHKRVNSTSDPPPDFLSRRSYRRLTDCFSRNNQWQWRSLVLLNIVINLVYWVLGDFYSYGRNKDKKYVYFYYLFLWGSISGITRVFTINYIILCWASMMHTSHAMKKLCKTWIRRLERYKKKTTKWYEDIHSNSNYTMPSLYKLQLDLYERYLLVVGVATISSRCYNVVAATGLLISAGMFVILQYLHYRENNGWYLLIGCVFGLAFFCIVSCFSYANTHAAMILDVLTKSVPELTDVNLSTITNDNSDEIQRDYKLVGGRDIWIKYVTQVPVQWTVYGFPVTVQWIAAFATAGAVTLVLTVLPSALDIHI